MSDDAGAPATRSRKKGKHRDKRKELRSKNDEDRTDLEDCEGVSSLAMSSAARRALKCRRLMMSLLALSEEKLHIVDQFISNINKEPSKEDLMDHLHRRAYVKLGSSSIHGVGVIALQTIPAGVNPFDVCNEHLKAREKYVTVSEDELGSVPSPVRELCHSFFAPMTDTSGFYPLRDDGGLVYGINATGTSTLDVSWYLNHSATPNVGYMEDDTQSDGFNAYVSLRAIEEGEELVVDYASLGDEFLKLVLQ